MATEQAVLQYEFAEAFFAELAEHVDSVVVSPGSRSTPLVLSAVGYPVFAGEQTSASRLKPVVVLDERSAGFVALGLAKASRRPVALVCTSGTAAANYLPGVVEAYHSRLPLVVITADRPASYHDWGSPQTIFQNGLYAKHVRWDTEVAVPRHNPRGGGRLTALRAIQNACGPPGGPVHINWPLEKPLEPPVSGASDADTSNPVSLDAEPFGTELNAGSPSSVPSETGSSNSAEADEFAISEGVAASGIGHLPENRATDRERPGLEQVAASVIGHLPENPQAIINPDLLPPAYTKGLIVVGHGNLSTSEAEAVARFSEAAGWPIAAEASSGMRFGDWNSNVLSCAHFLFSNPSALPQPDVAIRIGGHHIDRSLPRFLDTDFPQHRVVVAPPGCWDDPAFLATEFIHGDIAAIFNEAAESIPEGAPDHSWIAHWRDADGAAAEALAVVLEIREAPRDSATSGRPTESSGSASSSNNASSSASENLTEAKAVRILCDFLGNETQDILYASSSLPIRHLEFFATPASKPLRVLANRGANGIDGVISSSCGAALSKNASEVTASDSAASGSSASATSASDGAASEGTASENSSPTTVLLGDLALLHDIGGLLTAIQLGVSLRLVVLNNNGGAIFSQLPIADAVDADTFTKFFQTPHNLDLSFVGDFPGVRHTRVSTEDELMSALLETNGKVGHTSNISDEEPERQSEIAVIEIQTEASEHASVMNRCYEAVTAALGAI